MEKDAIEALRLAVEKRHHSKAIFKQRFSVKESGFSGEVFSFELTYDSKHSGATKEEIEKWHLPGPSAGALEAAELRGARIRKKLEEGRASNPEIRRRAKMAYAWSAKVKGNKKPKVHIVLHEGAVKSAVDAVKAAMGKGTAS